MNTNDKYLALLEDMAHRRSEFSPAKIVSKHKCGQGVPTVLNKMGLIKKVSRGKWKWAADAPTLAKANRVRQLLIESISKREGVNGHPNKAIISKKYAPRTKKGVRPHATEPESVMPAGSVRDAVALLKSIGYVVLRPTLVEA